MDNFIAPELHPLFRPLLKAQQEADARARRQAADELNHATGAAVAYIDSIYMDYSEMIAQHRGTNGEAVGLGAVALGNMVIDRLCEATKQVEELAYPKAAGTEGGVR